MLQRCVQGRGRHEWASGWSCGGGEGANGPLAGRVGEGKGRREWASGVIVPSASGGMAQKPLPVDRRLLETDPP